MGIRIISYAGLTSDGIRGEGSTEADSDIVRDYLLVKGADQARIKTVRMSSDNPPAENLATGPEKAGIEIQIEVAGIDGSITVSPLQTF